MVHFTGLKSKLPPTTRQRGGYAFVETKTNAWAALIGFLTGRGYSSVAIAECLDDGTAPTTVRWMQQRWGLHSAGYSGRDVVLSVPLNPRQRANLAARAAQRGLSIEEYSRRILICASMPVDLYDAVVPEGQFD